MRNIPALIVIIIAIVALIVVIGFVVASITHKYTTKELETEELTQVENIPELDQKIYALQLFASDKYSRVEHQKQKLEKQGYNTNVVKTMKEGGILYRLRLDGLYGEKEATALGEEIKRKFPSIQNYWLDQVGSDNEEPVEFATQDYQPTNQDTHQTQTPQTQQPVISNLGGKQYEVQLMASSNYAKIEEAKGALSRLGYETKIVNKAEGNKVVYRLRLKNQYDKTSAISLGEKIIKDSPLISGYWLDEMKNGKSVPNQQQISKSIEPVKTQTTQSKQTTKSTGGGQKIYEIQLLANTKLDMVEKRKRDLENAGYSAKILSVVVNGTTYYRLRLNESFTQPDAKDIGEILKKNVSFVKDYWIVKKTANDKVVTKSNNTVKKEVPKQEIKKETPKEEEKLPVETDVSANPLYQSKRVDYSATCNTNEVNIRIGPGSHFEVDPIGKLMQGITVFVVEEKNNWARFTITPNDESWSGWVKLEYLDKN